jgi:hypothetical protein
MKHIKIYEDFLNEAKGKPTKDSSIKDHYGKTIKQVLEDEDGENEYLTIQFTDNTEMYITAYPTGNGGVGLVVESVNEGDMTKDYDGFIILDFKTKKLYKGRYIKGVKNTKAEDITIDKAMKLTGSPRSNFAVHGFIKKGKWNESETEVLEAIDTKYWADYNTDTSGKGNKEFANKSTDFEDTFSHAVSDWNEEADGAENRIKGSQVSKIKKLAQELYKKEVWISVNVAQAMISQEGY